MTRALMFMGTGSDVGKSLVVAGLCRAFTNRGLNVAPFKPQNMSNNAAVTKDGGEIGRAQALQARAAKRQPETAMNPVLLKPEGETGSQVVVRGQRVASMSASEYFKTRAQFMPDVVGAYAALAQTAELVLIEGAGSASEINLRHNDLANFGFARAVGAPVVLIGDIERGGVIASLVGTLQVIDPKDADLIVASLINKFRGDPSLFEQGLEMISAQTDRPVFGPLPYFVDANSLPAEDSLGLADGPHQGGAIKIAVPRLPHIANFDDLDPLRAEPDVELVLVQPGAPIPRDTDLIILPGSKSTRADMDALRKNGWDIDIQAHARAGGYVLGICGGYQMLGQTIADPEGIEGPSGQSQGLGLLDVETSLAATKQLRLAQAFHASSNQPMQGYHMHMGQSAGPDRAQPFARVDENDEGAMSPNKRIMGTYLHGLFAADGFRRAFLTELGATPDPDLQFEAHIEQVLDALAAHCEAHLDLDALLALARPINLPIRVSA